MAAQYDLKPFVLNLNDLVYLLQQVNFVPLFDGPANSNGIVAFDGSVDAYSANGVKLWDAVTGSVTAAAIDLGYTSLADLGTGFPQVSSPIGIRDVTGLHNNLFGDQALWGAVDVPFRRDIPADFNNYVTSPGADYTPGATVLDYMPRIISRTITTGGVNLLKDAGGHYVNWDSTRYGADAAYAALVDASGVDILQLVEGAKIVAPVTTQIQLLDAHGDPLIWSTGAYQMSALYAVTLATQSILSLGGLFGSATGGPLVDGGAIYMQMSPGVYTLATTLGNFDADLLAYKQIVDASGLDFADFVTGQPITTTVELSHGYGLLEELGHIDFQNPNSGEYFIGSENPGVAPVNSWFGIFGQFFDHGLDLIGKGGNGKVIIQLETTDPLYRAPGTNGADDPGNTAIVISRATIAGNDANGDPNYINHTSPFIDQSQTYGSSEQITSLLREWVLDADGTGYHAGMELFDGTTLQDTWTRRWPDGTTTEVNDTLPTLSELRDHVLDTGRAELTWADVADYRNRDADGQLSGGNSGHALILDMNTRFDAAHLTSTVDINGTTIAQRVANAVTEMGATVGASIENMANYAALNAARSTAGDTFSQNPDGTLKLHLASDLLVYTGPGNPPMTLTAGDYTGATALLPWVNMANFDIMSPPPGLDAVQGAALQAAVGEILMASIGDHYVAGDGRVNENFGLTSIHHVFHEEHNYQVENLKNWIYQHDAANSPGTHDGLHAWQVDTGTQDAAGNFTYGVGGEIAWDADKMFNATKLIVEMEYQHAAVDQYARTVTPRIQEFVGYSTGVDSTVSLEYAQVAFRFGHSTIRETIDTVDPSGWMLGAVTRFALESAFLNPQQYAETGVAAITLGLSRQQMNEVDEIVTSALNQGLLGQGLDLPAINIARGRDLGIPTLNDFREGISLARYTSWDDFGANMIHPESLVNFIAAYSFNGDIAKADAVMGLADGSIAEGSAAAMGFTTSDALAFMLNNAAANAELNTARDGFNHIDAWIGGLAEAHVPGGLLGETFDAVFVAQIQSLMDGDRFYYLYRLFGTQIHEEVNNGQFKDIVERNTGLSHLNGSIFAYADKYYDFNRAADGTLDGTGDNFADHLYHDQLALNPTLGIYSDGGTLAIAASQNGSLITMTGSDFIRADVTTQFIRDVRAEADPTQVHTVEGTPTSGADSHEVIVATDNIDYIHARGGDDTVYGEGGNDFIFGDGGVDRLYGGAGDDTIDTGEGPDLADGGAGKDIIYGRGSGSEVGGFDQLVGGSGNDLIVGGEGIDKLSSGSGDDIVFGDGITNPEMGNTDPFTHGGDGNDYIDGGASGDLLHGEEGDDYIVGGNDQDLMTGNNGDDILRPGNPSQAINGGPDEVIGDDGRVNTGFDMIDFSDYAANAAGVRIDFATQNNPLPAIDGITPFPAWFQIESAIGSRNNDTFIGDSAGDATAGVSGGGNWLVGGAGTDSFTGNGGDDIIVGGSIRLDELIGQYADAANASGPGNLALGSAAWLADAMRSGSSGYTGANDGYDNDTENAYTGASNRATGDLLQNGLIDAANAAGGTFAKHFTDMLGSRMFKDLVLGDGAGDTAADTVHFAGGRFDYIVTKVTGPGGMTAYMISDTVAGRDGTDLVTGIDNFDFNGVVLSSEAALLNEQPVFAAASAALSVAENTAGPLGNDGATDTEVLTYAVLGADAALFAINAATGALSFSPPANFEAPTDTGADNVYEVVVRATDTFGAFAEQAVAITVTNADDPGSGTINVSTTNFSSTGSTATVSAVGSYTDPDAPGGVTLAFQWSRTSGNATPVSPTGSTVVLQAGSQVSTYALTATYDDGFPPVKTVTTSDTVVLGTNSANAALTGGTGNDAMFGFGGDDTIDGGTGNDALDGGGGTDTALISGRVLGASYARSGGGGGTTTLTVQTSTGETETLRSIETLRYGATNYNLVLGTNTGGGGGGGGNNNLTGANGADLILGFSGNDQLNGGQGSDAIDAGDGNDTVTYTVTPTFANSDTNNSGRDLVDGGANTGAGDTFIVSGNNRAENFEVWSRDAYLPGGLDDDTEIVITRNGLVIAELDNIEEIVINGNGGTDTYAVHGSFAATSLFQQTITINGGSGNDTVNVTDLDSAHRVVFNTGTGTDKLIGARAQDQVNRTIEGTTGSDVLIGGSGSDILNGNDSSDMLADCGGSDTASGGAGNDWFIASGGNDILDGGDGSDMFYANASKVAVNVNLTTGKASGASIGSDTLISIESVTGGSGSDVVIGNAANNVLITGAGNDHVHGGYGNDKIEAGTGNDVMTGGPGADRFVFETGFGNDVITDFDAVTDDVQDRIDISALMISDDDFGARVHIADAGNDVLISIDSNSILLKNVTDASQVTISDFVLFAA